MQSLQALALRSAITICHALHVLLCLPQSNAKVHLMLRRLATGDTSASTGICRGIPTISCIRSSSTSRTGVRMRIATATSSQLF